MKNLIFTFVITCLFYACNHNSSKKEVEQNLKITNTEIIDTTLVNNNGVSLNLIFDNTKETLIITLNNETSELKRDKTGSGSQYSNTSFIYNNWHGITTLKKDDQLIFEHKKDVD